MPNWQPKPCRPSSEAAVWFCTPCAHSLCHLHVAKTTPKPGSPQITHPLAVILAISPALAAPPCPTAAASLPFSNCKGKRREVWSWKSLPFAATAQAIRSTLILASTRGARSGRAATQLLCSGGEVQRGCDGWSCPRPCSGHQAQPCLVQTWDAPEDAAGPRLVKHSTAFGLLPAVRLGLIFQNCQENSLVGIKRARILPVSCRRQLHPAALYRSPLPLCLAEAFCANTAVFTSDAPGLTPCSSATWARLECCSVCNAAGRTCWGKSARNAAAA